MVSDHTDSLVFALSSGAIMWSWFYFPSCLPDSYNRWISEAAQVHKRLIETLRDARTEKFDYGEDIDSAHILKDMCKDYKCPIEWGDPKKSIPIPCEVVHLGTGPSCHWHALLRFARAFRSGMATNLPL